MARPRDVVLGLSLALVAGLLGVQAAAPAKANPGQTLAIKGGLIHTQTDAGSFIGTVVIRDGKIVAVAPVPQIPAGATIIDAEGCVITPGLIDARGTIGLNPAAANEGGKEATLDILNAVDPFAEDWRDAARQGVTTVYVQPAGSGNLGGSGAVLRIGPAETLEELSLRSPAGVQMALGLAPRAEAPATSSTSEFQSRRGFPIPTPTPAPSAPPPATTLTRYAQAEQVRGLLDSARKYGESKPARREPPKELLLQAIKGEIPVRIEVHHEDDLRNAMRLSSEFNLKAIFERVDRVKPIPEEFARGRSGMVLGPLLGAKGAADLKKLALDGRKFAIGTFGDEPRATAGLRLHAAAAVAAGYPRERVLRALTSDAADLLGAGDRLGRIAEGRVVDLAIFAGDPLDVSAPVRFTICQGHVTHDDRTAPPAPLPLQATPTVPGKLPASYILKTRRLLTSSGEFAPGEVRVVDGLLAGPNGSPLPVIDVGDAPVTPGFVAAHLSVGGEAAPDADAAQLRATDELAVDDARIRGCREAGFLTVVAAPGSSNVLGGVASAVRANAAAQPVDAGFKFVLTSAARSRERYPVSLGGQFEFIDARLRGGPSHTNLHLPPSVRQGLMALRDGALQTVRDRQVTACFEAQTPAEIRAALRLIAEHKLRGVLVGPREIDQLSDEIHKAGVAVVVAPIKPQDLERRTDGLVTLGKLGVPLAFAGDASEARQSAALLTNAGLPRSAARRGLLGQPAEAVGLPAGTSRLLPGDAADLVIWSGDPLDTTSRPLAVVVQGQRMGASEKETKTETSAPSAGPVRRSGTGQ